MKENHEMLLNVFRSEKYLEIVLEDENRISLRVGSRVKNRTTDKIWDSQNINITPDELTILAENWLGREPKIAPCPVCEGINLLMEYERLDGYTIFCQDCFIGLHQFYPNEKECREAWNALPRKGE